MTKATIAAFAVLFCASGISGCASIVKGSSQTVSIATPPVSGANCTLSSKEGTWDVLTPGAVTVQKSKEDIQIHCSKAGYLEASATIPSNFQGWTLGNLLIGGIIGLGVDAATGAINEYPHVFEVPMTPGQSSIPADTSTMTTSGKPNS